MKTIIIFIGLKLAEIAGVCLAYVLLSLPGHYIMETYLHNYDYVWYSVPAFLFGVIAILVAWFIGYVVYSLFPLWFKYNWNWSKKLSKRK